MKKYFILSFLLCGVVFSQRYDFEDVVYLKDGSEIHGVIIEQKPNEYIKIQSGKNVFVYQMDEIELIRREPISSKNTEQRENNHKEYGENTENWYTYWALGSTTPIYSDDFINLMKESSTSFSESYGYRDAFGYYRHFNANAILGFIINSNYHRIEGNIPETWGNYTQRINIYLYSLSYINFSKTFGKGFFYRADIGLTDGSNTTIIENSNDISTPMDGQFGLLLGGGYSWDLGGTRILLNINYSLKKIDLQTQKNLSLSLGGLF